MKEQSPKQSQSKQGLDDFERKLRRNRKLSFGIPCAIVGGLSLVVTVSLVFIRSPLGLTWIAVIGAFSVSMLGYGVKTLMQGEVDDTESLLFSAEGDRQLLEDETAMWRCPDCENENSNRTTTCEKCSYSLV